MEKATKNATSNPVLIKLSTGLQAPVVRKVDNATHWINHYPADSEVCFC